MARCAAQLAIRRTPEGQQVTPDAVLDTAFREFNLLLSSPRSPRGGSPTDGPCPAVRMRSGRSSQTNTPPASQDTLRVRSIPDPASLTLTECRSNYRELPATSP